MTTIDYDDLISRSLHVQTSDTERVQFAHDDDVHPSPWALRWDELELICQLSSSNDPGFEFPGPLLLLLQPFAPLLDDDDITHIAGLVEASWRSLGMFEADELQTRIDRIDTRSPTMGFITNLETGSKTFGPDPTSDQPTETLRHNRDSSTHAGRAVDQYIARVRSVAHRDGLGALTAGLGGEDHATTVLLPRPSHSLSLTIPLDDPKWPLPRPAGKLITDTIDTVLAGLNLGNCSASGGSMSAAGQWLTNTSSLRLVGDQDAALSVVASLLRWFGVPESARLSDYRSLDPPFHLGDVAVDPVVSHLELSQIEVVEIASLNEHRFDRRVVGEVVRAAVRSALVDSDSQVTESRDGWLFHVRCSDGGELSIRCQAAEYDPTGLVITVENLSVGVADLVHSVASQADLWILPMMAAPANTVADSITANWPPRQTVDASGLFALLDAGPLSPA